MLDAWLDLVHGAACVVCEEPGRLLCRTCAADLPSGGHRVRPDPCPAGLAPAFASGAYAGPLRDLVVAHKEHRAFALARPLGSVLAGVLADLVPVEDSRVLLVPVPSRAVVVRQRGHDPMLRMSRFGAARLRSVGVDARVLTLLRQREVVADQAGLNAVDRAANLAGSMAAESRVLAALARSRRPTVVLLCDDVITTGSTAREAQRALEDNGVAVRGIGCVAATERRLPTVHQARGC